MPKFASAFLKPTMAALCFFVCNNEAFADWQSLKLGGGGFITGYDVSNDGSTRVIRTDTYGDYRWDAASSKWVQMLTSASMGANVAVPGAGTYVYEVVVAPGAPSRLYRWWSGKVYRSDDTGANWIATNYPKASDNIMDGGLAFSSRLFGKKMAVDPANPNVVLSGSYLDGIRISTDGGTSWTDLSSSIPKSSLNGYKVNSSYPNGATSISVTGTSGIPTGSVIYFDNNTGTGHTVTAGLSSGSGTISIVPPLKASVISGTQVLSSGGFAIAFDPSSQVVGGRTQGIYVASYGNGVFRSTNGGSTWSSIGGPATFKHMRVASDGLVYVLDNGLTSVLQKFSAGSWISISSVGQLDALAIDPNNPARIVLNGGGFLKTTTDRGLTWKETAGAYWSPNCLSGFVAQKRVAVDVPWLAWTQECIMTPADIRFDPALPGTVSRLWFAQGIGVWYYDFLSTTSAPTEQIVWTSQNAGIEQLVTNWIVSPPRGVPIVLAWDRPVFHVSNLQSYPSTHGPTAAVPINMGWSADYASSYPSTLAAIFNYWGPIEQSGISTDGGRTWTKFASVPSNVTSGGIGGGIAVSTPLNILWCPNNNRAPSYTLDGGRSWVTLTSAEIPNLPQDGSENGFGFAYYTNHQGCAADRVRPNQFYMHNYLSSPNLAGIYRTKDGGRSWVRIYNRLFTPGASAAQASLRTVPGYAGHMFFAHGTQGSNPLANFGGFFLSTNGDAAEAGGQIWQPVANVGGVISFGYGAIAPGNDYPTVFLAGWVNNVYGVWRGVGSAAKWATGGIGVVWTNLTANSNGAPLGNFDTVKTVEGDANTFGTVYVGFAGSGAAYYTDGSTTSDPTPSDPIEPIPSDPTKNRGKGPKKDR